MLEDKNFAMTNANLGPGVLEETGKPQKDGVFSLPARKFSKAAT